MSPTRAANDGTFIALLSASTKEQPLDLGLVRQGLLIVAVEPTIKRLLEQEDLDRNGLITIDDHGPKVKAYVVWNHSVQTL